VVQRQQQPTLGQSMKEGFGLGVGVSVAQRLVDGVFGARPPALAPAPAPVPQLPVQPCAETLKALSACYKHFERDCPVELTAYMECMKAEKSIGSA
jgi:hypothetical protein